MSNIKNKIKSKARMMALTVKAVVLNEDGKVLVLKRAKKNPLNPGKYDLPGGHVEAGETLSDSISREIQEETGLRVVVGNIIDVVEFSQDNPLFKEEKRGIRYICYSNSNEVKLSQEHDEYEWISFNQVTEKLSIEDEFEKEKIETIQKAQTYLEMKNSVNRWKRCLADFENYKKREEKSKKELVAFSNLNLITEILPVLDNFYSSTEHIPAEQKENAWVIGIMHIQHQLEKVLIDNGVEEITIKEGDKFDPKIMEALDSKDNKENDLQNKVAKIIQKGYKMKDRIIRPARVIVK
jgi:molecular chaperone GrpE